MGTFRSKGAGLKVDGFDIGVADSIAELAAHCNVIVTTTPSLHWLLGAADVRPGTHITAVGSDGSGKQELDPQLFAKAKFAPSIVENSARSTGIPPTHSRRA